ncbi:MAG: hypothetical protein PVH82_16915, partial [Desulfobacteraceae bacterium]
YFYGSKLLLYNSFQQHGEIPLWNPYIMFGQPVVGNIQYALFYPLNFLFLLLPFFKALWIYQAIHMAIAGLGTYLMSKNAGCNRWASMVAGCLYLLSGRMLYYIDAGWLTYFSSICWLPLFVLTSKLTLEKKERHFPVAMGIMFAMTFLAGTPQYALLGFCLFVAQGIGHIVLANSMNQRVSVISRILLAALISFLLISVQFFPAVEQAHLSSRIFSETPGHGFHFDWSLKQWLRILFRPEILPHDFAWELCAYIGIGGMLLSFFGIIVSKKAFWQVVIWGFVPWLISMGPAFPPFEWAMRIVPGFSMLTNPSRYFIFTILMLCVSAGRGLELLFSSQGLHKRSYLFLFAAALGLILAGLIVSPYSQPAGVLESSLISMTLVFSLLCALFFWRKTNLLRLLIICWLLIDPLLMSTDILKGYHREDLKPPSKIIGELNNYGQPARIATFQPEDLRDTLLNPFDDWLCIKYGIARASGYEPLAMLETLQFLTRMDGTGSISQTMWGFRLWAFARPELYDISGVTHIMTFKPISNPRLRFITQDFITMPHFHGGWWRDKPVYLYENLRVFPRAFFIAEDSSGSVASIPLKYSSANRMHLYFRSNNPGTAIVSESLHPGWIAKEQEKTVVLKPFLGNFISWKVPSGEHEIVLEFSPQSLRLGLGLTQFGLILILLILFYEKRLSFKDRKRD